MTDALKYICRVLCFSAESMKTGLPSFIILKRGDPVGSMVNRDDFNHMKNFVKDNILPTYVSLRKLWLTRIML